MTGTVLLAVLLYGDPVTTRAARFLGLILIGVVGLKLVE
jgi:multidrug transporter EmrE-like cation transporter